MEVKETLLPSAMQLVTEFGILPDLIGSHYIAHAIALYSANRCNFNSIYKTIAESFSVKYKSVLRAITYAINNSYSLHEKLCAAFKLNIPKTEIHSSLVIAYLSILLNKK